MTIPQGSLSKCNNSVKLLSPLLTGMYMSGVHLVGEDEEEALGQDRQRIKLGQKELRRQWDGTGTGQRGQKAGSNPQDVGKINSPVMESKVPQTLSLLCSGSSASHTPGTGRQFAPAPAAVVSQSAESWVMAQTSQADDSRTRVDEAESTSVTRMPLEKNK